MKSFHVFTAANGVPFLARRVEKGDKYGLDDCLTNNGEVLVEFYDVRYRHTAYGQFVTRYYLKTMLERVGSPWDLKLDGGYSEWTVDAKNFDKAIKALTE